MDSPFSDRIMESKYENTHEDSEEEEEEDSEREEEILKWLKEDPDVNINIDQESKCEVPSPLELKLRKKKALLNFRCMVEDAINGNYILENPYINNNDSVSNEEDEEDNDDDDHKKRKKKKKKKKKKKRTYCKVISMQEKLQIKEQIREISLWGVPLLPSKGHEGTDTVLLKFLKAKNFKVHEAFHMLKKTLKWRKEFNTDTIIEEKLEDLDQNLDKVLYIDSVDKQGHPLYYALYGAFKDKLLYEKVLGTEKDRQKFLRWRIQFIEKTIKNNLKFKAGEANSILQITDFKNGPPRTEMKELRDISKKIYLLLQANYPEIIFKNILINVPFWYYTTHLLASKLSTQRTRRKLIFVRQSRVTQKLSTYISPENLPVEYGGLKRENDADFLPEDIPVEVIVGGNTSTSIQIPVPQAEVTVVWDFTVVGWEVTCKEEFVPEDEGSYKVLLRKYKEKRLGESVRNSFYISEPGKLVITVENNAIKKRKAYYRFKIKPFIPHL